MIAQIFANATTIRETVAEELSQLNDQIEAAQKRQAFLEKLQEALNFMNFIVESAPSAGVDIQEFLKFPEQPTVESQDRISSSEWEAFKKYASDNGIAGKWIKNALSELGVEKARELSPFQFTLLQDKVREELEKSAAELKATIDPVAAAKKQKHIQITKGKYRGCHYPVKIKAKTGYSIEIPGIGEKFFPYEECIEVDSDQLQRESDEVTRKMIENSDRRAIARMEGKLPQVGINERGTSQLSWRRR